MVHSPGFLKMVEGAKPYVKELTIEQAKERLARNQDAVLVDVREDAEWEKDHAAEAVHLGKGVLERDIEQMFPQQDKELIMYCGGGYRSILTAAAAQEMGYRNVYSLIGGYKGMVKAGWEMRRGEG
jgi:rhodanese-related sulfurtransferase